MGVWNGYGVVQAKFRRTSAGTRDVDWLRRQITKELDAWVGPCSKRVTNGRLPEYLIIATNVRLSSVAGTGGIDRICKCWAGTPTGSASKVGRCGTPTNCRPTSTPIPRSAPGSPEFLTPGDVLVKTFNALSQLTAKAAGRKPLRVGQGHPGNERAFQAAYQAAGGAPMLGAATSDVYEDGPGWVQHFTRPMFSRTVARSGSSVAMSATVRISSFRNVQALRISFSVSMWGASIR